MAYSPSSTSEHMTGAPAPKAGKNALTFVLITVMINAIGFGIIIPVLPSLIVELTGQPLSEAALHGGWMTFVFAVMQFYCMPIVGALSDAYGRRPIMLLSLSGLALDYFLMALAPTIFFLYVGRVIAGAFGATFSTANAYIADVTPPEKRAQNFGLVGAAFGLGFILGPAIGGILGDPEGWLGEWANPRLPFLAAGVLAVINTIYGVIFLPETHKPENRRPFSWARANPFGALAALGKIKGVKGLLFVFFILAVAHTAYPSAYTFSTLAKLSWTEKDVGLSLAAFGLASAIVQGGLIRIIIPKIGQFWAAIWGIFSAALGYYIIGVSTAGWMIYAAGPFAAFAGLYGPSITNMMSSRVSEKDQGELQGAIGAAQGLAMMIGPLMMTRVFNIFAQEDAQIYQPGAPFILAAILVGLSLLAFIGVTNKSDRDQRHNAASAALASEASE